MSPNDEFSNFEILTYLLGEPQGRFDHIVGSYARQALKDGLTMQDTKGYNPYKFGVVGGSDSHNTGTPYRQDNFYGGHGEADGTIEGRMAGHIFAGMDTRYENPAGVSGVWAEENTRASIFEAMQRKETFAASGPHIKLRFFGGWNYKSSDVEDKDWVKTGYKEGVPMGGDLKKMDSKAPTFIVWAVKDPTSGNLDRIQIVKGWTKSGQSFEKIFDVVWAGDRKPDVASGKVPSIGSTVDLANATYTNTHRLNGTENGMDGPGIRSEPPCVLLRPRAGDSHAALDHDSSTSIGGADPRRSCRDRSGTRVEFADLVYTFRGRPQESTARAQRGGPETEGRRGPNECAADSLGGE